MFGAKSAAIAVAIVCALLACWSLVPPASAHQPTIRNQAKAANTSSPEEFYRSAVKINDPTSASQAVYGRLQSPGEIHLFTFTAAKNESIPIEALVPARPSNMEFRPALVVVGKDILPSSQQQPLPFPALAGSNARLISPPQQAERSVFFEPFSIEKLWRGAEEKIAVAAGTTYYVALYELRHRVGDYSLGLGTVEDFSNTSFARVLGNVLEIKMGMADKPVPKTDLVGLFLLVMGLSLNFGAARRNAYCIAGRKIQSTPSGRRCELPHCCAGLDWRQL